MTIVAEARTPTAPASRWRRWSPARVGALTVYDMVKGIEPRRRRSSASSCSTRPAARRTSTGDSTREPLVDGHGRPIGDVRISVTDRCNFRCQYCMPAEGLPWLERDALLTYEEIARLVAAARPRWACTTSA